MSDGRTYKEILDDEDNLGLSSRDFMEEDLGRKEAWEERADRNQIALQGGLFAPSWYSPWDRNNLD